MATQNDGWRSSSTFIFSSLIGLNAALCGYVTGMAARDRVLRLLPDNIGFGVRLLVFLLGSALAWQFGRFMLVALIRGHVLLAESVPGSWILVLLVAMFFVFAAFSGQIASILLIVVALALLLASVLVLWRLLGAMVTASTIVLSLIGGAAFFYFTRIS